MRGRSSGRSRAWRRCVAAGLLCGCALSVPAAARGGTRPPPSAAGALTIGSPALPPPEDGEEPAAEGEAGPPLAAPSEGEPSTSEPPWIDSQRLTVGRGLGALIERFDRFFGDDRRLDLEAPSTRLRLKGFGRTAQDKDFTWGVAAVAAVQLPRLERILGNARLVLVGENAGARIAEPGVGTTPPAGEPPPPPPGSVGAPSPARSSGRAELRFDVVRRDPLIFDTGAGFTLSWPIIPFARFRAHLRLGLGAGFVLRATEELFVELGGLGFGANTDLLVERYILTAVRLRWEGHGIAAQHTRGIEWNTLIGAEWKPHRLTGLNAGVQAVGFGTPSPGLDTWRTWIGIRQDLHRGWVFAELEPEVGWPRLAGAPRRQVLAVTLRVEVVIEGQASVVGAARP